MAGPCESVFRRGVFHIAKVGIFRYFLASAILLLARLRYFHEAAPQANDRDTLLRRAYSQFHFQCRMTHGSAAVRFFFPSFFNAKSWTAFGWINCKASDAMLFLGWLDTFLAGLLNDPKDPRHMSILRYMKLAATAARDFTRTPYSCGLWLPRQGGWYVYERVHTFLQAYNACALLSVTAHDYAGFGLTGKFHALCHLKRDILTMLLGPNTKWILNPQAFGCEMNEDVIGKLSRLNRRVNSRRSSSFT